MEVETMNLSVLDQLSSHRCACGRAHVFASKVLVKSGAIAELPALVRALPASRVFVLADENTYEAAGRAVCAALESAGIGVSLYVFPEKTPKPDELHTGMALLHYDAACDAVLSVGSGVLNDIGKVLSAAAGKPYVIVGTAPSMDGYASATSSMTRDGLKITLPSKCPDLIVGDLDVLCQAPQEMLLSGLGDMLAKYVSICEWRIGHLITGEYYCETIAQMVRTALRRCISQADGLLRREPEAVAAVFEGLILGGAAMGCAGVSRPASGMEHYISHIWDMRAIQFGTPETFHGTQCAVGTLLVLRAYEKLRTVTPDREAALRHAWQFRYAPWAAQLRALLGRSAESMIALEAKEGKYDPQAHEKRLEIILTHWQELLQIMQEELPSSQELESLMQRLGLPVRAAQLEQDEALLPTVMNAAKDIRDKYVLSRLVWDLGLSDTFFEDLR